MLNILKLFGRSPFAPLQTHMEKVSLCVLRLRDLFEALEKGDRDQLIKVAEEISEFEHAADLIKNDIRNHLPRSLFLSIDRSALLEMLSLQDNLADRAEDIAVILTLKDLKLLDSFRDEFYAFFNKNIDVFLQVHAVISELHELLEASFGGIEAEKVRSMVEEVAYQEHQADLIQRELLKNFYSSDAEMSPSTFYLWQKIFETLAGIANTSEKLAYRVRMTLEIS